MRMLTERETLFVSGGDDAEGGGNFWDDVETIGEYGAAVGAGIFLIAAAPEILAVGSITEGTLFLTGAGAYVSVDAAVIAEGSGAITAALQGAGVTIGAGGAVVQGVGTYGGHSETPLQ